MFDFIFEKSRWKFFCIGLFLFFTILSWWRMLHFAENTGYFVDESIHFTAAAANFFSDLNYTGYSFNRPFDPRMSSGIAASWPTGLSWNAGFSIFTQRILLIVYCWGQFLVASFFLLKRFGYSKYFSICAAAFLWMFVLRHIPNTIGFIQNLGEVAAGIFLLWSVVLFPVIPIFAFISLGISVWLAKLVFLPVAFALGATYWLSTAQLHKKEFFRFSKFLLAFFLPLAIWILLIITRFGWDGFVQWIIEYHRFVFLEGPSVARGEMKLSFMERLSRLEWGTFNLTLKMKILIYIFGPSLFGYFLFHRGSRWEKIFSILAPGILFLYSYWWFFLNPEMYLRHFHPALFLGFGFLVYLGIVFLRSIEKKNQKIVPILIFVFFLSSTVSEVRLLIRDSIPFWAGETSYARSCTGPVWNSVCAPGYDFESD